MPLARIFTRNPEGTADLSGQLRQQGYTVEVSSPDQPNLAPADLEIEFEICERADVLDRAAELADELGADVAVSPGVLKPAIQHAAETSVPPMVEPELVPQNLVELMSLPGSEHREQDAVERDRERDFEAAFASVIEMPAAMQASPEEIDVPVMEHEPMPPVAFLEDPVPAAPAAMAAMPEKHPETPFAFSHQSRPADPMPYLAQLTPFSAPTARAEEQPRAAKQVKEPSQLQVRGKKVLQDGAKVAAQAWANALALASSTTASVRDRFEEYRKRAQVRSAEARAQHAARLLDLEQRRAEAQQRATELEAAREAAAARLLQLVRQRDPGLPKEGLPESLPPELWPEATAVERHIPVQSQPPQSAYERMQDKNKEERAVPLVAAQVREPVQKPARVSALASPIQFWRGINPPLRAVLSGAAAVTALFIMGIALGVFHSRTPLANPANHASNGVTVKTGGVTVQAGAAKPQAAQPATGIQTQAKPQPGQPAAAGQAATTATKPSPRVRQARLVAQQSENEIGDDVVIRHYSRPVPTQKPKQTGQQAGLKHFSDLDN